jgi:UDP-glucose:glycoprotein glucosyltransferase
VKSLPFDRVSQDGAAAQAVFYFDPEDTTTHKFELLTSLDQRTRNEPSFAYIIRYKPSPDRRSGTKSKLAGYGVELALKKTDYLVVDDRATGDISSSPASDHSSNATLTSGTFEEILGSDPWAELSTPLSKFEVMGESECAIMAEIRPRT